MFHIYETVRDPPAGAPAADPAMSAVHNVPRTGSPARGTIAEAILNTICGGRLRARNPLYNRTPLFANPPLDKPPAAA